MQTDLIQRLGEHLDLTQTPIRSIIATAGGVPTPRPAPPAPAPLQQLDEAAAARLEHLVETIDDPVLREQVLRAAINSTRRRRDTRQ